VLRPLIAAWKAWRPMPPITQVVNPPGAPQAIANAPVWQGKSLTSTVGLLIVRAGPGTNYQRLGAIDSGQVYPIQDEVNGWFQIIYNGQKGYVSSKMVKCSNAMLLTAGASGAAKCFPKQLFPSPGACGSINWMLSAPDA